MHVECCISVVKGAIDMANPAPNEAWANWADSMQKMLSNPAALNPFAGMLGMPAGSSAAPFDAQQLMKAIDPAEIDRRVQDLRAVEAWMKVALSGVEMSIRALEMQRDAYASLHKMSESASKTVQQGAAAAAEAVRGARTVKRASRGKASAR